MPHIPACRIGLAIRSPIFHDLRQTAASFLLVQSGAELAELKYVLGHSQIAHTVDLYGHLVPGRLEGAAGDVRRRLAAAKQPVPPPAAASDRPGLRLAT